MTHISPDIGYLLETASVNAVGELLQFAQVNQTELTKVDPEYANLTGAFRYITQSTSDCNNSVITQFLWPYTEILHLYRVRRNLWIDLLNEARRALSSDHAIEPRAEARLSFSVADGYRTLGRAAEAISYYKKATELWRLVNNPAEEAASLQYLGLSYAMLERHEHAIHYYHMCLEVSRKHHIKKCIVRVLDDLGSSYLKLGQEKLGYRYLIEALELAKQMSDPGTVAGVKLRLGRYYASRGKFKRSLTLYTEVLTIRERLGDEFQQLIVLTDFVELYTLQQEYPAAIDIAEQALALDPRRRYGRQLAKLSLCMGDVHWACHNYEAALESYLEACRYGAAVAPQDYKKAVVGSLSKRLKITSRFSGTNSVVPLWASNMFFDH